MKQLLKFVKILFPTLSLIVVFFRLFTKVGVRQPFQLMTEICSITDKLAISVYKADIKSFKFKVYKQSYLVH